MGWNIRDYQQLLTALMLWCQGVRVQETTWLPLMMTSPPPLRGSQPSSILVHCFSNGDLCSDPLCCWSFNKLIYNLCADCFSLSRVSSHSSFNQMHLRYCSFQRPVWLKGCCFSNANFGLCFHIGEHSADWLTLQKRTHMTQDVSHFEMWGSVRCLLMWVFCF